MNRCYLCSYFVSQFLHRIALTHDQDNGPWCFKTSIWKSTLEIMFRHPTGKSSVFAANVGVTASAGELIYCIRPK